ncbi:putative bifunctional diguanylate cyclase/phosphodiesterase [Streptomyces spectabilis]|uniref:Diguanylate cyclase (GGDEF)-like protein/PAS domain S-box-containing protein n=1 Tax=Streptomyces spectabilis TaxID=68270 RepID=A0A5P2XBF1_STRST|nr:EAL domain-containing protein [Streptomyces spectabilis]MBB5104311.1 diguanylate cyclase (GGDEF)-like protein/PAS domain S-box-containing protein [Streptomyces spectabilis]MCI3905330.1 EAL domain-containing protein [Streptomyces spectabilis]QEV62327.1 EAL domain-containing protein [Streptomyces spectabilis]GGU99147.1 membrane associated phosphodiesterase [Streptomyces spectabilis]
MSGQTASASVLDGGLGAPLPSPGAPMARRPAPSGGTGLLSQVFLLLICGGYATGSALGWGSTRLALIMGDFGLSAAAAAAAVSCFFYSRTRRSRFRPAWLLFALSSAMAACGNAVWGWHEVVLGQRVPERGFADLFFLCFAPPAIIGLLVLAKRPVTKAGWVCLGLDAWLIGGSLLTLSWSLALAHTAQFEGPGVAHAALSLAYPLLDIALVSMVLALHFRRSSANRTAVNTAIGALALTVMCDALFTSPLLHASYRSGQLLDAGWFAGSLLLAYAPWATPRQGRADTDPTRLGHRPYDRPRAASVRDVRGARDPHDVRDVRDVHTARDPRDVRDVRDGRDPRDHERGDAVRYATTRPIAGSLAALTPYLAAAVCTLGILYNVLNGRSVDEVVLFTAGTVVLALVVRQGIMLLDNITLTQELAQKENHFRSLVQGSSDVIMIAAPSGILRYVSPAAAGVYGREADDLVGSELATLMHPEDLGRVVHEVRRFLAANPVEEPTTRIECRFKSGSGEWLNVESTVNRHHGGLIFNSRDVTERVRLQAQLQHNAEHDPLTDLPNRALFTRRVAQALGGRRVTDRGTAVLFIDLDGFKAVNDTIGHQAGDELLVMAAQRLQEAVRSSDTASRLGGDEFAALIVGDGTRDQAAREKHIMELADRLRLRLSQPYDIDGNDVRVAASIGVAFAEPGVGAGELLRNADLAMYRAKAAGKGRVELYAPQMQADVARKAELATRLRSALHEGEFTLLHQPVVALDSGRITSVAAQARWRSAQGIMFTPAEFLRTAEDGDRTAELGRWLLQEAVEQAADRALAGHAMPVSVRIGARRLVDRSLPLGSLEALLTRHGLPSGALVIELADSDPRVSLDELERRLTSLRRLGVRVALDGFGSGCAAITALRRLPVDVLKLDRGLVEGVVESARLHKITAGLLRIATDLGLDSVADGVDHPEQVVALRAMGCTHGQGMAFSGPLDEYRLRRALAMGEYPVPRGPVEPVCVGGPAVAPPDAFGGASAAYVSGTVAGATPFGRSHAETPVPPT